MTTEGQQDADQAFEQEPATEVLWCEECHRVVEADEVTDDGLCPRCGNELLLEDAANVRRRRVPWTFRLMLVATVVYLGWRAYQGISWIAHHV